MRKILSLSLPACLLLGCSLFETPAPGTQSAICAGLLTDVDEDRDNCGACGITCAPEDDCQLGSCAASRDWATFDVSSPRRELRPEGSTLVDDVTGLVWAAEASEPVDRYAADLHCRQLTLDGRTFRVPTMIQLSTLVSYTAARAPVESEQSTSGAPEALFYFRRSGATTSGLVDGTIDFAGQRHGSASTARVRCVALNPEAEPMGEHYEDQGDTFYDTKTRLLWARETSTPAPGGMGYDRPGSGSYDLADASNYCERAATGGFDDWRVPTALELLSLYAVNSASGQPYLAPIAVPTEEPLQGEYFAADETNGFGELTSWIVDYTSDGRWPARLDHARRTRCVRGPENL